MKRTYECRACRNGVDNPCILVIEELDGKPTACVFKFNIDEPHWRQKEELKDSINERTISDELVNAVAQKIIESGILDKKEERQYLLKYKVGDIVVAWNNNEDKVIGVLNEVENTPSEYPYLVSNVFWANIMPFNGSVEEALGL